jgi:arginase
VRHTAGRGSLALDRCGSGQVTGARQRVPCGVRGFEHRGLWEAGEVAAVIIEVPAMAGDGAHAASRGPAAITAALQAGGRPLAVRTLKVPPRDERVEAASLLVARELAAAVHDVTNTGQVPLVFAGSCDVAPGVLAGLADDRCGVVWIDAHADFNTPRSSRSGFWPGMTLAVVVGDCGEHTRATLGVAAIPESHVALLGVRSLSPAAEAQRLSASELHIVGWRDGQPERSVAEALDRLAEHVDRAYVHLDLDVLDPSIGRGVVDALVPGGLSAGQLIDLLLEVRKRFAVVATTIATYVPANDDGNTLATAVTAAELFLDPDR